MNDVEVQSTVPKLYKDLLRARSVAQRQLPRQRSRCRSWNFRRLLFQQIVYKNSGNQSVKPFPVKKK